MVKELTNFKVKINLQSHDTYRVWREGVNDDFVLAVAIACRWSENSRPELFSDITIKEERKPQTLYINGYQVSYKDTMWVVGDYLKKSKGGLLRSLGKMGVILSLKKPHLTHHGSKGAFGDFDYITKMEGYGWALFIPIAPSNLSHME